MEKLSYIAPELEIIELEHENVITDSTCPADDTCNGYYCDGEVQYY